MKLTLRAALSLGFVAGALAAIACGSAAPTAPSLSSTVYAEVPPNGLTFQSGAGMTEQGDWLFIRGRATQHYGPVGIAGTVHLTSLDGDGTRFLCVTANNAIYASPKPCR